MNKIIGLAIVVLVASITATAAVAPNVDSGKGGQDAMVDAKSGSQDQGKGITSRLKVEDKEMIKSALKSHLSSVNHGYGIGFSGENYLTARWQIVSVRTMSMEQIRSMVAQANRTNWSGLREELNLRLQNGIEQSKGRIRIGKADYALTGMDATNSTLTADIRNLPDYAVCRESNVTYQDCELAAEKVGSLSLERKTEAFEDSEKARVWAGSLEFRGVSYTFVTFAYPRWSQ